MGGSGVLLVLLSFLKWFGIEAKVAGFGTFATYSENAWGSIFSLLGVLLALVIVVVLALQKFSTVKLPELPMPLTQAYLVGSVAVAALILLQFLIGGSKDGFDLDRKIGLYLGSLAAIGMAVGGFLQSKEPSTSSGPTTTF
jgi:hypothetical protein